MLLCLKKINTIHNECGIFCNYILSNSQPSSLTWCMFVGAWGRCVHALGSQGSVLFKHRRSVRRWWAAWNGEWWHQNKAGAWLRWPLNMAETHSAPVKCWGKKRFFPCCLSLRKSDSPPAATQCPTWFINKVSWVHFMSHLSFAAVLWSHKY